MTSIGTSRKLNQIGKYKWLIGVETGLYLGFLYLDSAGFSLISSYIKYLSILFLCICIGCISIRNRRKQWIPTALLGSAVADVFLLFTDHFVWGIFLFLLVQAALFMEISQVGYRSYHTRVLGRMISILCLLCLFFCLHLADDPVVILATIYIVCFAGNLVDGWVIFLSKRSCKKGMLAVGLLLFFLCDLHVGLYNLPGFLGVETDWMNQLVDWAGIAMWLFYLPGQTLIGLSNFLNN